MGLGAVGTGTPMGGSEWEGWTLHRGAFPCSRDPAVEVEAWSHLRVEEVYLDGWVSKKRWHSHAPGTRLLKLKLGRTFGWRKFASTVGSKKKGHRTYILPPCPPPCVGGLWTGWGRRPFKSRQVCPGSNRPFKTRQVRPGLPLTSGSRVLWATQWPVHGAG